MEKQANSTEAKAIEPGGTMQGDGTDTSGMLSEADRLRLRRVAAATYLLARELDKDSLEGFEHADVLMDCFVRLHELSLKQS